LDEVGKDESPTLKPFIMSALSKHGVEYVMQHKLLAIRESYAEAENKSGEVKKLLCDFVVLATGAIPDNTLLSGAKKHSTTYSVGDCLQPRFLSNAVREAYWAAIEI
jgi:thioredoxin reductase